MEFIRFAYTDFKSGNNDFHVVVKGLGMEEEVEGILRNALLATDCKSVILLVETENDTTDKLKEIFPYVQVMTTDEYIHFLKK